MKWLLAAATALVLAVTPLAAAQSATRASLPDIEDEVMCPTCGVPLSHAFSPQAERERDFIRAEIERGRSKQQIKDALVAEFGPEVLAEPDPGERGFDVVAYLVPVAAVVARSARGVAGASRARRRRGPASRSRPRS